MSSTVVSRSPQAPDDVVGEFPAADAAAVRSAVDVARTAGRGWSETAAADRSRLLNAVATELERHSGELAALMTAEVGKPASEAAGEMRRAVDIMRFNAQLALLPTGEVHPPDGRQQRLLTLRRPHGAVGLITPWNFPVAIPLWKAAPALALGNAVVIKPSSEAAATAARLFDLVASVLPPDVVRVVHGGREPGGALVDSADAVSFTGSTAVGTRVVAAAVARSTPVQAEMGGHNASIVMPDADPGTAASSIAYSITGYAGQKCTATRKVVVVGERPDVMEALVHAVDGATVGDPADAATVTGPVINDAARNGFTDALAAATGGGGRILTSTGRRLPDSGHFVRPTLVDGLDLDAPLLCDEVFGPIAAVVTVRDEEEAIAVANAGEYGLTGAVYGTDLDRAQQVAGRLHVGMAKVNEPTTGASIHIPFGGEGMSSFGPREQGLAAVHMYTWTQTLAVSGS